MHDPEDCSERRGDDDASAAAELQEISRLLLHSLSAAVEHRDEVCLEDVEIWAMAARAIGEALAVCESSGCTPRESEDVKGARAAIIEAHWLVADLLARDLGR